MGQKRLAVVDLSQEEESTKQPRKRQTQKSAPVVRQKGSGLARRSGSAKTGRLADMSEKVLEEEKARQVKESKKDPKEATPTSKKPLKKKERSRRYRLAKSQVDRTQTYPLSEAIELLKKVSTARFDASVEAHLNLTETKLKAEVQFPHSTGRKTRVAIASDTVLKQINKGKLDFDVLLATPPMMAKIAKVAKILGPKGLMPNPKSGTIVKDPEKKKKELEAGQTLVKSETKMPLMHVIVGKISFKDSQLAANLEALITAITPAKITKLTLASSMSPGIKVDLSSFPAA